MSLDKIKKALELMKEFELTDFHIKLEEFELRASRSENTPVVVHQTGPATVMPIAAPVNAAAPAAAPAAAETEAGLVEITSPIVGTFYSKPKPESPSFVEVGEEVISDTVVCLVEAMKVFNEIHAEVEGTIVKVLVEDSKPVEFGTPLFLVRPSI